MAPYHFIHRWLRCCPSCGSTQAYQFLLCQTCLGELKGQAQGVLHQKNGIPIRSLWNWQQDKNKVLSILIKNLKGHPIEKDWAKLAEMFLALQQVQNSVQGSTVLVPCPSRTGTTSAQNHAYQWAQALGKSWGCQVTDALEKPQGTAPQKKQSRSGRAEVSIQPNENISQIPIQNHTIIFVDDVVTTGATARAAWIALGRPNKFEVWCLAHRRLAGLELL